MNWFTADLHLGHANIIKHCNRPFAHVNDMDTYILDKINTYVSKRDTLWVVGDFSLGGLSAVKSYRGQIKCKDVRLVRGNHDRNCVDVVFKHVYDLAHISILGVRATLCHYAMLRWPKCGGGAIHLFGHSHGQLTWCAPNSMDIGVDCHHFRPLCDEEIIKALSPRGTNDL